MDARNHSGAPIAAGMLVSAGARREAQEAIEQLSAPLARDGGGGTRAAAAVQQAAGGAAADGEAPLRGAPTDLRDTSPLLGASAAPSHPPGGTSTAASHPEGASDAAPSHPPGGTGDASPRWSQLDAGGSGCGYDRIERQVALVGQRLSSDGASPGAGAAACLLPVPPALLPVVLTLALLAHSPAAPPFF
jgi:hypothetical protein